MCGIFGIILRDSSVPSRDLLQRTGTLLGHRGPDHVGLYSAPGIGLVHTRLSLLDLSERGNQPFWDETGRYALVYNGEIYNFKTIRDELALQGTRFSTDSDTEVLLKGLLAYGVDAIVPRLEGMFAFGLWDTQEHRLTLVRDRLGIKPLTVFADEQKLIFASEIKAMNGWTHLQPDCHMASAFLSGFGGATRDKSFFRNVRIVAPGTIISVTSDLAVEEHRFFETEDFWSAEERQKLQSLSAGKLVDYFDEKLLVSVEKHLLADAPVGALCSGGLDSSLIMAMAKRTHNNLAIFHANVAGPLSEFDSAKALADFLKLDLLYVDVQDVDFLGEMASVLWHYEYPYFYHPNSVPFLSVSRLVRRSGVKAVLSGEGADECFLGYGPIAYTDLRTKYRRLLLRMRKVFHQIPKLGKGLWPPPSGHFESIGKLQQNFERELDGLSVEDKMRKVDLGLPEREFRSLEWLGYHLRTLLHRNDALGMAASVEARFPYLDHAVVTSAASLPYKYKIRPSLSAHDRSHPFLVDKWVQRKVAERYIPPRLSRRKKVGFPTSAYSRLHCPPEFFRGGFVSELYQLDQRSESQLLQASDPDFNVRLVMLEVWGRLFFRQTAEADVTETLNRLVTIHSPA